MSTYNEELQHLFSRYCDEHAMPTEGVDPTEVAEWAIARGLWQARSKDLARQLADDLARAWREEYRTDEQGRRYRTKHAVRMPGEGRQKSLWADIETATRNHMQRAFTQRRNQIVGDCVQLRVDCDVYNDKRPNQDPIQIILDFTNDVEEDRRAKAKRLPLAA